MREFFLVTVLSLALAGCAKSPASIAPAYISRNTYSGWSCSQLNEETLKLEAALATASEQQEKARSNDVVGVILIGLPVSSLSDDNIAPQIANLKGQKEAVHQARIEKNC